LNKSFKLGDFEIFWLNGGRFELDGGAMFGVVPKKLWEKKYPADEENFIPLTAWPLLVKTPDALVVIETGIGNKLTEKQRTIFRVREEWDIPGSLAGLGLSAEDIDYVILTHLDFDHAGGIVMQKSDGLSLTFPEAKHVIQKREWEDALNPNKRAAHSYWAVNFELLKGSDDLHLVDGEAEVSPGVKTVLSGGHHRGHQIVLLESAGEKAIHMGDVLPTHVHFNPLWVMAYDDYPLEVIALKEEWVKRGVEEGAWFTFYHDPEVLACVLDGSGEIIRKWP